ncbi:MAG: GH3 auxin-responsive promoter family protein [Planctomycetaceae bacterium]|nr:GH3 auxin-responsive promoter family protein [Planctomycetaceae bacterium]
MNPGRGLSALKSVFIEGVGALLRAKVRKIRGRFLNACLDCEQTQRKTLSRILALNVGSQLSQDYELTPSLSVSEFREKFPISEYDLYKPYIDKMREGDHSALLGPRNELLMFALSSGTTNESKFVPITKPFLNDYREGWRIWGIGAVDGHPGCDRGHIFQITSSQNRFITEAGTPCGNISGLVSSMQNRVLRRLYTLPAAVADIKDPDAKYYTVLRIALADESITWVTTANPGTLVRLSGILHHNAQQLIDDIRTGQISADLTDQQRQAIQGAYTKPLPERADFLANIYQQTGTLLPKDCWPRLTLLAIWTGGSAGAYLPRIRSLFGDVAIRDHGLHASEGRMTIPLNGGTSEGVLDIVSHFFEFIPEEVADREDPPTLLAHELEPGQNYYILMTTVSGLYRYNIRDVVQCTGFEGTTPVLKFLHKGAHISNITGEKVTESQVVDAVRQAASDLGLAVPQFVVAPVWGDPPAYRLIVEASEYDSEATLQELSGRVDNNLCDLNVEYCEKRHTDRLARLTGQFVADGTMENLARNRNQRKGGSLEQYKHPCLIPDLQFIEQLSEIESVSATAAN